MYHQHLSTTNKVAVCVSSDVFGVESREPCVNYYLEDNENIQPSAKADKESDTGELLLPW